MTKRDTPAASVLPTVQDVTRFWERNGLKASSAVQYRHWVNRYLTHCERKQISPLPSLTSVGIAHFAAAYARRRRIDRQEARRQAQQALHAWSIGLSAAGVQVQAWVQPRIRPVLAGPWFPEYRAFRRAHSSAQDDSIERELVDVDAWLRFLRARKQKLRTVRVADADAYMLQLRRRLAVATVARALTSLRLFLRFLNLTGRLRYDIASSVQSAPRRPAQLPRALSWPEVQRLLRAVDRQTLTGQRDYAILLLMSLYGLGSAEVIALKLDDIQWLPRTLKVVRPKTGVSIELPLLPGAARVVARYLRQCRPPDAPTRALFVRRSMPHVAFSSSAIRYAIRKYARKAGLQAAVFGGHVLRHSHASRQVDQRTPARILSSILGHRDWESTSTYTRVAVERLRGLALPVPR